MIDIEGDITAFLATCTDKLLAAEDAIKEMAAVGCNQ
jgi:hypothetical protein